MICLKMGFGNLNLFQYPSTFRRALPGLRSSAPFTQRRLNSVLWYCTPSLQQSCSNFYLIFLGDLGYQASSLLGYFERNGARPCDPEENP